MCFQISAAKFIDLEATDKVEGSRHQLLEEAALVIAVTTAETMLGKLIIVVEEKYKVKQALLELYVADALEAPYNHFDNN